MAYTDHKPGDRVTAHLHKNPVGNPPAGFTKGKVYTVTSSFMVPDDNNYFWAANGGLYLFMPYQERPEETQPTSLGRVTELKTASSPTKEHMIKLLDDLRKEIDEGETISLVVIPHHSNGGFSTRSCGGIRMLALAGLLSRAWMDAVEALKDDGR